VAGQHGREIRSACVPDSTTLAAILGSAQVKDPRGRSAPLQGYPSAELARRANGRERQASDKTGTHS